ncbi:ImmA/IrrE family metallo-endopeptidase [Amphibacillus sp. Q70]|uniref:ImmA/IrrE family metallo-endopeptidase n=1 Tax=Amphibacillus sp. Q70 TaxID=3453416 RepID=UPI003F83A8EF
MRIKKIAEQLINQYDTNDPYLLAEHLNIIIFEKGLHEEIMGFYKYNRRNKFIILNTNLNEQLKQFTAAHELSHAILHPRSNTPFLRKNTLYPVGKIEREANQLAVELLLPDQSIYEHKHTNMTINEIGGVYNIPDEVIHLKNFYDSDQTNIL